MEKKRYVILDALRGFAILGICLANYPEFSLWTFSDQSLWTASDKVTRAVLTFFVDGKFYTLFSLLFGMGFSIQIANAGQKTKTFYRRMTVLFLIGFATGREGMFADPARHRKLLRSLLSYGFLLGIPVSFLYVWSSMSGNPFGPVVHGVFYLLSVYPMGFAYAAGFCLLYLRHKEGKGWRLLANPGKVACTNYLMQSVLGVLIFYGIGFGLGGKVGLLGTEAVALGIYALEIAVSTLWLKYFRFGPVEWVWRMLTYGQRLPLKK